MPRESHVNVLSHNPLSLFSGISCIPRRRKISIFLLTVATLVVALPLHSSLVHAQNFSAGCAGEDGVLDFTGMGPEVAFDPRDPAFNLNADDNVFCFSEIIVPAGVTVRLLASRLNAAPLYWLCTGNVTIDGTIDASGADGHPASSILSERRPSEPGPGGYPGGLGNNSVANPVRSRQSGTGPGAGMIENLPNCGSICPGGGASHATLGTGRVPPGPVYGNPFLVPLLGGSGGAGPFVTTDFGLGGIGWGGGAGGGALLIASADSIVIGGTILANGGGGVDVSHVTTTPNGSGGSGGAIHLKALTISGSGTLEAIGGIHVTDGQSAEGGLGRIRLEAFQNNFTGTANPVPALAEPSSVILPVDQPLIHVTAINNEDVPLNPKAELGVDVDVPIDTDAVATVSIEAFNIPLDADVWLHLVSDNDADQVIMDASPQNRVGDAANWTTDMSAVIPNGFSRAFVRAKWNP